MRKGTSIRKSTDRIVEVNKTAQKTDRLTSRTIATPRSRVLDGFSVFPVNSMYELPQCDAEKSTVQATCLSIFGLIFDAFNVSSLA